jgi:hypothetical protein
MSAVYVIREAFLHVGFPPPEDKIVLELAKSIGFIA